MARTSFTVRVPAKVNLQLAVGPLRSDGFHELVTVFHAVDIFDDVTAQAVPDGSGISLTMAGEGSEKLPVDSSNLAYRAASLLAGHVGIDPDVSLTVQKNIPIAGGMAGGSADAAATLVACDALWQLGTPREELDALAAQLGSDVNFALHGGTAIGTGRGEQLTTVLTTGTFHWVFALADGGLSTPAVYAKCDELRADQPVPAPTADPVLLQALRAGDPAALGSALSNDLQAATLALKPRLAQTLETGLAHGAVGALVSGSGPTCAFLARDEEQALDIAVALTSSGTCRTVKRARGPVPGARLVDA
jgi:4-diphosphocytidyl-2-C-methyl-D-erythritol kinase